MVQVIEVFKGYPASVRNAIMFLCFSWLWHYVSLYRYFFHGDLPFNQIVIGVSICYFVFRIKNWARVLCIVCNILIIVMYLSLTFSFMTAAKTHFAAISGINVLLFSMATYYLFVGESSRFFKAHSPRHADQEPESREPEED